MEYPLVYRALQVAVQQDSVHHAYLFFGDTIKKLNEFATRVASLLQCERARESGEPCGSCQYCQAHRVGYPLDVYILARDEGENTIKIDQARRFIQEVGKTGHGGVKIGLIIGADFLTDEAKESLLKTVEEPAPKTVLLLLAEDKDALPVTLLSRCQQWYCYSDELDFSPDEQEQLASDLRILTGESGYQKMLWAQEVAAREDARIYMRTILQYGYQFLQSKTYLESRQEYAKMISMLGKIPRLLEQLSASPSSRRLLLEVFVLEIPSS